MFQSIGPNVDSGPVSCAVDGVCKVWRFSMAFVVYLCKGYPSVLTCCPSAFRNLFVTQAGDIWDTANLNVC